MVSRSENGEMAFNVRVLIHNFRVFLEPPSIIFGMGILGMSICGCSRARLSSYHEGSVKLHQVFLLKWSLAKGHGLKDMFWKQNKSQPNGSRRFPSTKRSPSEESFNRNLSGRVEYKMVLICFFDLGVGSYSQNWSLQTRPSRIMLQSSVDVRRLLLLMAVFRASCFSRCRCLTVSQVSRSGVRCACLLVW